MEPKQPRKPLTWNERPVNLAERRLKIYNGRNEIEMGRLRLHAKGSINTNFIVGHMNCPVSETEAEILVFHKRDSKNIQCIYKVNH